MKNAIKYQNVWLMPGSHAHKLHSEGEMKELAAHMRQLDAKDKQLKEVP